MGLPSFLPSFLPSSLPSFHYLLHILLQLCQSLSMSFFRPWFARPCKLEIPWWLSCRWLLASSSLLALVPLSLQRPVCDVLSRFSSLNSFIPYQIRFQRPFNAASYLLSLPFTHCLVRVSSLSCPNLFR